MVLYPSEFVPSAQNEQQSQMIFKAHRRNKSLVLPTSKQTQPLKHSQHLQSSPNSHAILQKAKQAYYHQCDFPTAINLFQQYLYFHPKCNEALYLSGVAYLHINRPMEAIERLQLVGQDYHNHPNSLLLAAIAINKMGGKNRSLELMDLCLRLYPDFEEALCFRGRLHFQMGCYTQAEMNFQRAVDVNQNSYLGVMGLADCLKATSDYTQAIQFYIHLQRILSQNQTNKTTTLHLQAELKIAICLYCLQDYSSSQARLTALTSYQQARGCELYYYLGLCELKKGNVQRGVLSLEYAVRLQSNMSIVNKAYKRLVLHYFEGCQFYEALNVLMLGEQSGVKLKEWKLAIQGFMAVIKGHYEVALQIITDLLLKIKEDKEELSSKLKVKEITENNQVQLINLRNPIKIGLPSSNKKSLFFESPKAKQKVNSLRRHHNSFGNSVAKAIAKIGSVRNHRSSLRTSNNQIIRHKTQHLPSTTQPKKSIEFPPPPKNERTFSVKERELIYPLLLKFKAYALFFTSHYLQCTETYQQYESYLKDMYASQSECLYNRQLCEAMMMSQDDMADQALLKLGECIQSYFQRHHKVPVEAILYKVALLVRLAAYKKTIEQSAQTDRSESQIANSQEILSSTLLMLQNYSTVIGQHHLTHFYSSLVYILQHEYSHARQCLERGLKMVEECHWKYLYVKGTVQMCLENYYDAVKEYSAGLILEVRAQFYLGRAIAFCMLGQEEGQIREEAFDSLMKSIKISADLIKEKVGKEHHIDINKGQRQHQILLELCLADLERYVELVKDKQEMGKWIPRLLFAVGSYEEALGALSKMEINTSELVQITECIEIYEGQYQNGGNAGLIIKSAFDGVFLSQSQEARLLEITAPLKNYRSLEMDYLHPSYEKWLTILHLYITENYSLLLKFMQRELFSIREEKEQLLVRYNLFVVYLLVGEQSKARKLASSMGRFQGVYAIGGFIQKVEDEQFENDECMEEMGWVYGARRGRLLSHSLPFRQTIIKKGQQDLRVYVRINLPFPDFPMPDLQLKVDAEFILQQVSLDMIEKKLEAPWIRKTNKMVQFTDKIEDSRLNDSQFSSMQGDSFNSSHHQP